MEDQMSKKFYKDRLGEMTTNLLKMHGHQIDTKTELFEIRKELRSMNLGIEGMNDSLDEIVSLLRQSNKESYSQTAALQYLVQEAKEMEDK